MPTGIKEQKMKQPLVSILVPIYNVEPYIEKCAYSIFNQTYINIEYIFVDDSSPDNSVNILIDSISNFPNRKEYIKIIRHKQNTGIAIVRNTCLDNATGDYILFIDSDDWIEQDMVEKLVYTIQKGEADIAACDFTMDYINNKRIYHYEDYSNSCNENLKKAINYNIGTVLWKLLIKRNLFVNNKIRFIPHLDVGEDYVMTIKIYYYAKKISYIHETLYHYVQYNINRYSNVNLKNLENHIAAVTEVELFCKEKNIYKNIVNEINLRKFNIKSYYILNPQFANYKKWKNTFPEINSIWRKINYSKHEKIIFWMAENNLYYIVLLIRWIKRWIKK